MDGQRVRAYQKHGKPVLAFRKDFSTLDHILTHKDIIEEGRAHGRQIYCSFVDFHEAFDIVPKARLMCRLHEMGVP